MASPFANLPNEFQAFAVLCAGSDAAAQITVRQLNPDSGATVATASGVYAIKRVRERQPFGSGQGGDMPADQCRFLLRADQLSFELKQRDEITDADGVVWVVDERGTEHIGFQAVYTASVSRKRS